MYLSDLLQKDIILQKAFEHPAMKIKPRSEYRPDIDVALKAVVSTIEYGVLTSISDRLKPALEDILEFQILMDGEHDEAENKGDWESAVDDAVEIAIEQYVPVLSADWLGRNTIDCRLHEENGIDKFCKSLSKEVFKQLTYEKTPAQVMSNAGILKADVEAMLQRHLTPTNTEIEQMSDQQAADLDAVIERIAEHVGPDYDILDITAQLDLASEDDDVLAMGAGKRLGLAEEDVQVLQGERFTYGDETGNMLADMLAAHFSGEETKKPAAPKKGRPTATPKKTKADPEAENEVLAASVLTTLRDCGAKDGDMATLMGVSRATYNNWSNDKTPCTPDDDHKNALRDVIVAKINALHEALASVDGTEAEMVF